MFPRHYVPFATLLGVLTAQFLLHGCIQGPSGGGGGDRPSSQYVNKRAPEPEHRLDIQFGNQIELLGYDVEPAEPSPGEKIRVTWYWHCKRPLSGEWSMFTHLVDHRTGQMCMGCNYDRESEGNLRAVYPPGRWKAGEYIRDIQRFTLPSKIPFEEAEIRIGIYQGSERLEITDGPHDRERRARGPHFPTGWEPPELPEIIVKRALGTLTIDGVLDEEDWARAAVTEAFVNATDGNRGRPRTKARFLYDAERLYIAFECEDDHLHSTFTKRDDPLWTQDAVEVFIDPPGKGRDYYEFQVSPAGKIFDTLVHSHPRRDDSYDGQPRAGVKIKGTLNDDSDNDNGWTVELAVPHSKLGAAKATPGKSWRINLFRLDDQLGKRRAFLGWSPPLANTTHVPSRFAKITFGPVATESPDQEPAAPEKQAPDAPTEEP